MDMDHRHTDSYLLVAAGALRFGELSRASDYKQSVAASTNGRLKWKQMVRQRRQRGRKPVFFDRCLVCIESCLVTAPKLSMYPKVVWHNSKGCATNTWQSIGSRIGVMKVRSSFAARLWRVPLSRSRGRGAVWAEIRVVVSDADYRRRGAICCMLSSCSRDHDLGDGFSVSYGTVLLIQYSGTRMRAR